jgi:signal transduction histidine kinase
MRKLVTGRLRKKPAGENQKWGMAPLQQSRAQTFDLTLLNPEAEDCHLTPKWSADIGAEAIPARLKGLDPDIDNRKRVEHGVGSAREELERRAQQPASELVEAMRASHLASLGELAAGVAHEINNPINGIINYAQILINECRPESLESDIGKRIVKEGDRIAEIAKSLLSFVRGEGEDTRPANIADILKECLVLTQAQLRKESIRLEVDLPDDLPEIKANFQQLQQVFLNIVNNARYALNHKYPARDQNKAIDIRGERVRIDTREHVRIAFFDRGVGIPADEVSMITKPFFSTKPLGKGTGLGLTITHKIITEHGGRLAFESVEGEFTRVTIDFPVMETP